MRHILRHFRSLLGSLPMAVTLLLAIGGVLAWGTIYELRFGTAAVQRVVYQSWGFQLLLGFLAVNLATAALLRFPWKLKHLPFVLAHIGIILILVGGIIGGRFGIDGQLVIPEGDTAHVLELPQQLLIVHDPEAELSHATPTHFEAAAWDQAPMTALTVPLGERTIELVVDQYFPDATIEETVTNAGPVDHVALQVRLQHEQQTVETWLFARDPERFGVQWGQAHVLLLEPTTQRDVDALLDPMLAVDAPRGVVAIEHPDGAWAREIPVPESFNEPIPLSGTDYAVTFREYFPDFAVTEEGLISRSDQPQNPAVALVLSGPEGADAHLLFALHPEFPALHGVTYQIPMQISYTHARAFAFPPNAIGLIRQPSGKLSALLTGPDGERDLLEAVVPGASYTHPALGYTFEILETYEQAMLEQDVVNRGETVRREAVHVIAREGDATDESWILAQGRAELTLGERPVMVEYRRAQRELPFTVKLLDFRKIDYPGTTMAAGFESDVSLTDPERGLMLMRQISMNEPLRYRGFSLFQSSFIEGPVETTVLAVRNDPGTPVVYLGFLVVIGGVVSMFIRRAKLGKDRRG